MQSLQIPRLIAKRDEITLVSVPGEFHPWYEGSDIKMPPLVISDGKEKTYTGWKSGYRSAIAIIDGRIIKYKGCNVQDALQNLKQDRPLYHDDPYGGMSAPNAVTELDSLDSVNRILRENGFHTNQRPVGIISYPPMFDGYHFSAAVTEIHDDSRILEIMQNVRNTKFAGDVSIKLAMEIGSKRKVLERAGFVWGEGNSHPGNVVIFIGEDGNVHADLTDFDDSEFVNRSDRSRTYVRVSEELFTLLDDPDTSSLVDRQKKLHGLDDYLTRKFKTGFWAGYQKPKYRPVVTAEELYEAFEF